jgi:hypothetical protein
VEVATSITTILLVDVNVESSPTYKYVPTSWAKHTKTIVRWTSCLENLSCSKLDIFFPSHVAAKVNLPRAISVCAVNWWLDVGQHRVQGRHLYRVGGVFSSNICCCCPLLRVWPEAVVICCCVPGWRGEINLLLFSSRVHVCPAIKDHRRCPSVAVSS